MNPSPRPPDTSDPPTLAFDEHGRPFSPRYGDVYRSRAGALDEAREVFLRGCELPRAWSGRPRFTILELGFGLGVNFLATLEAWRADPARPARLDFVSLELHPLSRSEVSRGHEAIGVAGTDARRLAGDLPPPIRGLHRLAFESGRVTLTLAWGDARDLAANLALAVDAFYLDGFAPSRNPAMWEPGLLRDLARLAVPGATLATYSVAGAVRHALADAGFDVTLEAGHGTKRSRLAARYAPRWRTFPPPPPAPAWESRTAIVVGGGVAGCACARALALRGWQVRLLERRAHPLSEGSAQPALADHLQLSPDDNRMSRLTRAALLMSRAPGATPLPWRAVEPLARGALQLAAGPDELLKWREMLARLALPEGFARALDAGEASQAAGVALPTGGLWLPDCEAFEPLALAERWRADAGDRLALATGIAVGAVRRAGSSWQVLDAAGEPFDEASVVVLANAGDAARLAPLASAGLRRVRGQTTHLAAERFAGLRAVLSADAYACPLGGGRTLVGSTYDDGESLAADPQADLSNLRRLARVTGADLDGLLPRARAGAAGHRWAARDHLPLVGAMPDEAAAARDAREFARNARLRLPRAPGLYGAFALGSRGLLWSVLAAEVLAAAIDGGAPPVERDLLASIDPARFLDRSLRRLGRAARPVPLG